MVNVVADQFRCSAGFDRDAIHAILIYLVPLEGPARAMVYHLNIFSTANSMPTQLQATPLQTQTDTPLPVEYT